MDFFDNRSADNIDLRQEMHHLIYGSTEVIAQGRDVVLRELTNTTCTACWDKTSGGSNNPHCIYCDGEGYMWSERIIKVFLVHGVAPIYKPGNLATGQYPQGDTGYLNTDRGTAFCEYRIFPNYERYTNDEQSRYDMIYDLKVDTSGRTVSPLVRTAKWKVLTVVPWHGDQGRVEFFELGLQKADV